MLVVFFLRGKKIVKLVLTTVPEIYILSLILLGQSKGIFGISYFTYKTCKG